MKTIDKRPPARISRFDFYDRLSSEREALLSSADKLASSLSLQGDLKGRVGTSGASSAFPGSIRDDVVEAMSRGAREAVSPRVLGDELRRLVKAYYGDDFDVAATNSCEAALGIAFDALLTPPQLGRGDTYRSRCIGLLERHAEHHLSYGRPFPPLYKEVFADRGAVAGELGITGRRALNTDIVMVPMAGARYEVHGPKMIPCPLLMETDAAATVASVTRAAAIHAADLSGFISLGYDTPGYGYRDKNPRGAPAIQAGIGALAAEYGVPYIVDNAWGVPFIGTDPRDIGADVMLYSMDKVSGAPTSGLMIGRETAMVNVRRALGIHSERFGAPSAHGKAAHVAADPGKVSLAALVQVLRVLLNEPERITRPIDETHDIVMEEYEKCRGRFAAALDITKSYNLGGVEINYERTWSSGQTGIPIFSNEDRIAGTQIFGAILARLGIIAVQSEDGNVLVTPGLGTVDGNGRVNARVMRVIARAIFMSLGLLQDWTAQVARAAA